MKSNRIFFLLLFFLQLFRLYSQPLKEYNYYKENYPKADVVYSNYFSELEITMKDDKPVLLYNTGEEFFYLGEMNSGYTNRSIHYSGFYQLLKYKAYSMEASNNKYNKVEVKDFKVNDFTNDNVFFDDSKELKFRYQKINKGDKTAIENLYQINETHFLPRFVISPFVDYEKIKFVLKVPETFEMGIDTFSWSKLKLNYQVVKKGKMVIHTWEGKSKKSLDYQSDGLDIDYISSQLHFRIKSYQVKDQKIEVLNDLNDLYKWNCQFLEKSSEDFMQFKSLSDSIVGRVTSPTEKASKIYNWVQNNIRYIAFEAGYEGHIPAKASLVCKERYGDCKGISNILYNLLKSQQLEAFLVWIGTRDLPYKYTEIPSPFVDNHMITAVKLNGQYVFLDGTANNLKFGLPSPFIQGKEAMIGLGNCNDYTIQMVPEVSDSLNIMYDSCSIKLSDKAIIGTGTMILKGYDRMVFLDRLNELNYKYILNQCRNYLIKGNNRFILDTVWFENFEDKNLPLKINYKFNIPEYALKIDDEYYLNLNLEKISVSDKIEVDRNVPVEYRFKRQEINVIYFELNKGINIVSIPETKSLIHDNFSFVNNYTKSSNFIYKKSNYTRSVLVIYPEQFSVFNKTIDTIQKNYSEQIILKNK